MPRSPEPSSSTSSAIIYLDPGPAKVAPLRLPLKTHQPYRAARAIGACIGFPPLRRRLRSTLPVSVFCPGMAARTMPLWNGAW
jgi:hypothetical protein